MQLNAWPWAVTILRHDHEPSLYYGMTMSRHYITAWPWAVTVLRHDHEPSLYYGMTMSRHYITAWPWTVTILRHDHEPSLYYGMTMDRHHITAHAPWSPVICACSSICQQHANYCAFRKLLNFPKQQKKYQSQMFKSSTFIMTTKYVIKAFFWFIITANCYI